MHKTYLIVIGFLLLVIIAGSYKFIIQGSVVESEDGRMAIQLAAGERDLILDEMREFLATVQQITKGVAEEDMQLVAVSAKKVGMAAQQAVPATLVGKLPLAFKQLGFDTHKQFDQLALDAESLEDGSYSLEQLSHLMNNCVACHEAYRLDVSQK